MSISVFLSTVTDEFGAYRVKLEGDLTRHDVAVKVQERFKDLGGDTLDKLDAYVAHCDAVVHLVGEMCGAAADRSQQDALVAKYPDLPQRLPPLGGALGEGATIPYTQWEAWLALYHGKPLMIAKAAPDAPRGDRGTRRPMAHALRKRRISRGSRRFIAIRAASLRIPTISPNTSPIRRSSICSVKATTADKAARERDSRRRLHQGDGEASGRRLSSRSRRHEAGRAERDRDL